MNQDIREAYFKAIEDAYVPLHPSLYRFNLKEMIHEDTVYWLYNPEEDAYGVPKCCQ